MARYTVTGPFPVCDVPTGGVVEIDEDGPVNVRALLKSGQVTIADEVDTEPEAPKLPRQPRAPKPPVEPEQETA